MRVMILYQAKNPVLQTFNYMIVVLILVMGFKNAQFIRQISIVMI